MPVQSASRRTPLAGACLSAAEARARFWSDPSGADVHAIRRDASGAAIRLFDLTGCERFGLKGRGSAGWLAGQGLAVPAAINTWAPTPAQDLDVLRLGGEDLVVLSRPGAPSGAPAALRAAWQADTARPRGFDAWRDETWAWFHICGDGLTDLMAMTCPVDLRPAAFELRSIVQTRVAQLDCVVVRSDRAGMHGFDLLFDIASAQFVLASMTELGAT